MRQTQATGSVRASHPDTRTHTGKAARPPCILGCINRKTLEPRLAKANDVLCSVCAQRIDHQAERGEAWLNAHLSQYGSWYQGVERALGRPKKHNKRGKH